MLITASIELSKIDESRIITGKTGRRYVDVKIWVNDEVDRYGNDVSIEQKTDKGEDKIYLGNGKVYKKAASASNDDLPY